MDDIEIRLAAVDEHYEEQNQLSGHPDDLITLLSSALDEVVIAHQAIRIVKHLHRYVERDPMGPLTSVGLSAVLT